MRKFAITQRFCSLLLGGGILVLTPQLSAHGTLDQAIAKARKEVVEIGGVSAKLRLAALLITHEEYEEATEIANACRAAEEPDAFLLLARIARYQEDEELALSHLEKFLTGRPRSAEGYFLRADLLAQKDAAGAALAQGKGIEFAGTAVTSDQFLKLSSFFVSAGKVDEALATLEKALEVNPSHLGLLEEKTRLLYQSGKRKEALAQLRELRERLPALSFRYWIIEADLLEGDDVATSRKALERALSSLKERGRARALSPALETLKRDVQLRLANSSKQ